MKPIDGDHLVAVLDLMFEHCNSASIDQTDRYYEGKKDAYASVRQFVGEMPAITTVFDYLDDGR